jgi:hypothetical protein
MYSDTAQRYSVVVKDNSALHIDGATTTISNVHVHTNNASKNT